MTTTHQSKDRLLGFVKDWMLIIGMVVGISSFLIYRTLPFLHPIGPSIAEAVKFIQPILIFLMLFLSFCKIKPSSLKPRKWMIWLLLIQCLSFITMAIFMIRFPEMHFRYGVEGAMLCMIMPTATACAVVTGKLGGSMEGVVSYTVLINLTVAVLVPAVIPLLHPMEGLSFWSACLKILAKIFPLLICPALAAWSIRYFIPALYRRLADMAGAAFYIWAVSLTLAVMMTTRSLCNTGGGLALLVEIGAVSLICCVLQFAAGHFIGKIHGCRVTAGQALGQKNTVFGIWLGYTFMTPAVSVAGGFYLIWHNCYNTLQLRRRSRLMRKDVEIENTVEDF